MTLERINPEDLPSPLGYTHVIVATGSRLVFVAGQEPEDEQGHLVGPGDLAVQARQVFATSAALSLLSVPGLSRCPRSRSSSFITGASTCQRLKRAGWPCSGITSRPTHSWEWRHCPDPNT